MWCWQILRAPCYIPSWLLPHHTVEGRNPANHQECNFATLKIVGSPGFLPPTVSVIRKETEVKGQQNGCAKTTYLLLALYAALLELNFGHMWEIPWADCGSFPTSSYWILQFLYTSWCSLKSSLSQWMERYNGRMKAKKATTIDRRQSMIWYWSLHSPTTLHHTSLSLFQTYQLVSRPANWWRIRYCLKHFRQSTTLFCKRGFAGFPVAEAKVPLRNKNQCKWGHHGFSGS